jgi:hypothetical protein
MPHRDVVSNIVRLAFASSAIVAMTYQLAAAAESGFHQANFFNVFTAMRSVFGRSRVTHFMRALPCRTRRPASRCRP